jgi:glycogen debranching enzyme
MKYKGQNKNIMMITPLIVTKDFNRPYFSKGKYHFLIYQLDGSVRGNKAGFYVPPLNLLDKLEFFVQIGKKNYLLHNYIRKVEISPIKTIHHFECGKRQIRITYFLPQEMRRLGIFIECDRKTKITAKFNFPFDYVWQENPYKKFKCIKNGKEINVVSEFDENLRCRIQSNKKLGLPKNNLIVFDGKDIELKILGFFGSDSTKKINLKKLENEKIKYFETGTIFNCNDKDLNQAFEFAKYNIKLLKHYQPGLGPGYFAGLPRFPEFFGRDTFWSIPGILMSGDFEGVKAAINTFIRHQSSVKTETKGVGEIPHEIWLTGEPNYYSGDSTLLFIHSLYDYYKWTGDLNYIKNAFDSIKLAVEWGIKKCKNGFVFHGKEGFLKDTTWMDSYFRGTIAIDVQALYIEGLKRASFLANKLKENKLSRRWDKFSQKTKSKIDKLWLKDRYADHINKNGTFSRSITINPFVVFLFELADKKKAERYFQNVKETGLWSNSGIRTRAKNSRGYDPKSTQKGSIWPFSNGWAALAYFKYGKCEDAYNILRNFPFWFQKFVPGFIPEYLDGEKANFFKGCYIQLWSSALYIQSIIGGLCGIKPIPPNIIEIKPNLPKQVNSIKINNLPIFGGKNYIIIKRIKDKIIIKHDVNVGRIKVLGP